MADLKPKKYLRKDGYINFRAPAEMQKEVNEMAGTDYQKSDIGLAIFELGLPLFKKKYPELAARITPNE
jgi:hypothetical protein